MRIESPSPSIEADSLQEIRFDLDLPLARFVPRRYRPHLSAWPGHACFANDLICAVRPELLVELGTHWGDSYFSFCQSIAQNGISCVCYAVDHWAGEPHAGEYGDAVFRDVQKHNDTFYKDFSYLLRKTFDEALPQFADESIDLLHIDGLHTYEAAKKDVSAWLPKVRPGGILLLHDVVGRQEDFGVWNVWDELKAEYAETFTFYHWWGLGVLRKPGNKGRHPKFLDVLFAEDQEVQERVREHYKLYASYVDNILLGGSTSPRLASREAADALPRVQVFSGDSEGYSELSSIRQEIAFGKWSRLSFELPGGIGSRPLRIDPTDRRCVVTMGEISVFLASSGQTLWSGKDPASLRSLALAGTARLLPDQSACQFLAHGEDPQLFLPMLHAKGPVRVELSVRLDRLWDVAEQIFQKLGEDRRWLASQVQSVEAQLKSFERITEDARSDAGRLALQVEALEHQRDGLQADINAVLNSRGWRFAEVLRRPLRILRRALH